VVTCSDDIQHSRIFWVLFTRAERSYREDRSIAQSSRPDVVLFLEESCYSRKIVAEDRPDESIFHPDAPQQKFEFV
jgi:hypothetical protein